MDDGHPLGSLLSEAARGVFPRPDSNVEVVGPPPGRAQAVAAFTAHHVIAADVRPEAVRAHLHPGDIGAPMNARFLAWLADELDAEPGMLDAVLVTFGGSEDVSPIDLVRRDDVVAHPRFARSRRYRDDIRVYTDPQDSIVLVGKGLAGRWEVGVEVDPGNRDHGVGRTLAAAARRLIPQDEPLFAQVSPGNVASLRAFLAAGYRPIGSEVLFLAH
jgi:hypothetical protein